MKKTLSVLLACLMMLTLFAACKSESPSPSAAGGTSSTPPADTSENPGDVSEAPAGPEMPEGTELKNGKIYFTETRTVSVRLFERNNAAISPDVSIYGKYIQEGVLRDHNIKVEFVVQPRDGEVDSLNAVLADKSAPGICYTYDYPTVQTYANMGGVINLYPYVTENKEFLPNIWSLLGETYIYFDKDPVTNDLWAIEGVRVANRRTNVFAREDWLTKLNVAEPKTIDEFETMLVAFKDNASTLLGADAGKMIPFGVDYDIGWKADHLVGAYTKADITEKERYYYGFDDRRTLYPGAKEAYRKLNDWYNKGLVWQDFILTKVGDTTFMNNIKAGFVGAFSGNWDDPYRDIPAEGGSIQVQLQKNVSPDAAYLPVEAFQNSEGIYRKFLPASNDRKVFFPIYNNTEPLASMVYLDWTCDINNYKFLQIGEEGVNHTYDANGQLVLQAAPDDKVEYSIYSQYNIDYTMLMNGLRLLDPALDQAGEVSNFIGTDPKYVGLATYYTSHDAVYSGNYQFGEIAAEEGMGPTLNEKRDAFLMKSVAAPVDKFDAEFDAGMDDYLASGGQAIIDERKAAWETYLGDATSMGG